MDKKASNSMGRTEYFASLKKAPKYGNDKSTGFDSVGEGIRNGELSLLQRAGAISGLRCQVPYILQEKMKGHRAIKIVVDFEYTENGKLVVEDFKGFATSVYKIKKKMFAAKYPDIEFREIRK
jgi:hypothetical protein